MEIQQFINKWKPFLSDSDRDVYMARLQKMEHDLKKVVNTNAQKIPCPICGDPKTRHYFGICNENMDSE